MKRKYALVNSCIYHVFNRSIADCVIFNDDDEYSRMREASLFYLFENQDFKFSRFKKISSRKEKPDASVDAPKNGQNKSVRIIAYCFMPTHYHFILKQLQDRGIEKFIGNIQNSYSRYFNLKHNRRGPLWEGRFRNVLIDNDEQLLHLTRHLHLNPINSELVNRPEKWEYSSYREYILTGIDHKNCDFSNDLSIDPEKYKEFVNCNNEYKNELHLIKHLTFE